jgi:hypothetical protein
MDKILSVASPPFRLDVGNLDELGVGFIVDHGCSNILVVML